ncbi:hypothetical protein OSH04_00590 [Alcaligenes sp. A-TC2]|uniref:hypothetical protein n=1 Tax=Alcaligenes nematophilus TaxID=2994643 RepID=UPI0022580D53|nr:hypothetical protein [Alcaligenes nematophilus]MCX5470202.1 hypothetical protein [Alcaligenes nematophilus]
MMNFIPSCDSREDAIRSLSLIYCVSIEKIEETLQDEEIFQFNEPYRDCNSDAFQFLLSRKLTARNDIKNACFYHSTSYDGNSSWFDDGLLGSSQGVNTFIEKISHLLSQEKLKLAKQQAQRVVMMRSEDEGFTAATTGPYAWSTYSAASKSEDGIRYRVPEAISDLWYGSEYVAGGLVNLTDVIERNLKPVVVKFKGKISNFDSHCAMLWAYVYSGSDECEIAQTFHGNGSAIPREDILELMDVSYAPNLR